MNLSREIDARKHAEARNDPEIFPWIRTPTKTNAEEQQAWFDSQRYFWSVQEGKDLVGMVGFTDVTKDDAEFSCLIYKEFRGQGLGYKALEHLFDYGFYAMKLNHIYGHTYGYLSEKPNALPVHVPFLGTVYLNPAYKLFQKFKMTINGPCLYPEHTNEKHGALIWRLDLPRFKYDSLVA